LYVLFTPGAAFVNLRNENDKIDSGQESICLKLENDTTVAGTKLEINTNSAQSRRVAREGPRWAWPTPKFAGPPVCPR
jgi:hypothetical protein